MPKRRFFDRNPEVIKRWVEIRFRKRIENIARYYLRAKNALRFSLPDRRRRKVHDLAINETHLFIERCERNGYERTKDLANASLFMLLALRDLESIKMRAVFSSDEWSRKLYLRVIILTCFEWSTQEVFNRDLYKSLELLSADNADIDDLKREIRTLRRRHDGFAKKYKSVRNELISHRASSSNEYLKRVRKLSEKEVINDVAELLENMDEISTIMSKIITKCGNIEGIKMAANAMNLTTSS